MRTSYFKICWLILPLFAIASCGPSGNTDSSSKTMEFKKIPVSYPVTRQDTTVVDTYFETAVKDPYRWLEDDMSEETADWVIEGPRKIDSKSVISQNHYLKLAPVSYKKLEK